MSFFPYNVTLDYTFYLTFNLCTLTSKGFCVPILDKNLILFIGGFTVISTFNESPGGTCTVSIFHLFSLTSDAQQFRWVVLNSPRNNICRRDGLSETYKL